jgi:hypothetical protein
MPRYRPYIQVVIDRGRCVISAMSISPSPSFFYSCLGVYGQRVRMPVEAITPQIAKGLASAAAASPLPSASPSPSPSLLPPTRGARGARGATIDLTSAVREALAAQAPLAEAADDDDMYAPRIDADALLTADADDELVTDAAYAAHVRGEEYGMSGAATGRAADEGDAENELDGLNAEDGEDGKSSDIRSLWSPTWGEGKLKGGSGKGAGGGARKGGGTPPQKIRKLGHSPGQQPTPDAILNASGQSRAAATKVDDDDDDEDGIAIDEQRSVGSVSAPPVADPLVFHRPRPRRHHHAAHAAAVQMFSSPPPPPAPAPAFRAPAPNNPFVAKSGRLGRLDLLGLPEPSSTAPKLHGAQSSVRAGRPVSSHPYMN